MRDQTMSRTWKLETSRKTSLSSRKNKNLKPKKSHLFKKSRTTTTTINMRKTRKHQLLYIQKELQDNQTIIQIHPHRFFHRQNNNNNNNQVRLFHMLQDDLRPLHHHNSIEGLSDHKTIITEDL